MPEHVSHREDLLPASVVAEVAALFDDAVAENRTAGITWGVIGGHDHAETLLAHGAAGDRELTDGEPTAASTPMDRGSISRICSMTKSFTAATILALRDEGRLRLDDPIAQYVPEAASLPAGSPDEPALTLRHVLTMAGGLVTDNPWGDRQQAMTREAFTRMMASGLSRNRRPGTGFEYSNTGYALLGRVIDEVTGQDYGDHITERFLRPLGMDSSAFHLEQVDRDRVATGHRLADRQDRTRFEPLPFDEHGVYGAMAGIFSSADDIARWVRFLAAADAVDAAERDQALLCTASRREMQQVHTLQVTPALPVGADGKSAGFDRLRGYGYGLVVEEFADLGSVVSHSGGYPGYGSFMVWHRDSGVGVVALANSKYAPAVPLSMQTLRLLREKAPTLLERRAEVAADRTLQAGEAALAWLRSPADDLADQWFADNMDLDIPRDERERRRDQALATAGLSLEDLAGLRVQDATVLSPAQLRWSLTGPQAKLQIDLLMDPRAESLIQAIDVSAPSLPGASNPARQEPRNF